MCSLATGCKSSNYIEPAGAKDYTRELPPGAKGLRKIDPSQYPDFAAGFGDRDGMIQALDASAAYLARNSAQGYFPYLDISHDRAEASILAFREDLVNAKDGSELDRRIRSRYDVYESVGWNMNGEMLITAYCEPIYEGLAEAHLQVQVSHLSAAAGARERRDRRQVLLEIARRIEEAGAVARRAPGDPRLAQIEMVYLADPFDAYVVQVQGSARFQLTDGRELRVGYAGDNGHDYQPAWKGLVDSGKLKKEEVSLRRLREYFKAHPGEAEKAIASNPRFVFFAERQGAAVGCLNVPVTPWHSIATDRNKRTTSSRARRWLS